MTYLAMQILWVLSQKNDWKNAAFVSEQGRPGQLALKKKKKKRAIIPILTQKIKKQEPWKQIQ